MNAKAKAPDNPRAYLLKGEDEHRKQETLDKLLKSLVDKDFADFDFEQLEGNTATADRIMAGLNVPPFSSKQRVVLVKYANKMPEDEQIKLASKLDKTPSTGCLILTNPAAEKADGKPKKGSEVVGDLSKAIRKIGTVEEFGKMKTDAAMKFAEAIFFKAGKKADSRTLAAFVQRVGTDSSIIATEARKLIDYSGDSGHIMAEYVAAVTSETPEEKIFKLIDAVSARNASDALRLLDELFEAGDDPTADAPKTLANIARQFRLLWQAKLLMEANVKAFNRQSVPEEIQATLPSEPNILDVLARLAWQESRFKQQARPFTRKDLIRCFTAISKADLSLKSIEGNMDDPRMIMELLVVELARRVN